MTTDPLDIQSVIAAGRGDVWTGVPDGTTMGDVHLHVGSWATRRAFTTMRLGSTRQCGATRERCSCRRVAITTTWRRSTWSSSPAASAHEARLLEWELIVPSDADVQAVARNLRHAGYSVDGTDGRVLAADP